MSTKPPKRITPDSRMLSADAFPIWTDPSLTVEEALARMPGWSLSACYRQLGPRNPPSSPRRKHTHVDDRLPIREARAIWTDASLGISEALERMPGWTQASCYRALGPRGTPAGRKADAKR